MHRRPTDREHAVPPYWLRSRRSRGDARLASERESLARSRAIACKQVLRVVPGVVPPMYHEMRLYSLLPHRFLPSLCRRGLLRAGRYSL